MAASGQVTIALEAFDAAVFDLDGVVTNTAGVHAATWKQLFDAYLHQRSERTGEPFRPFDAHEDYLRYVDGKPRYEGVQSFLQSRGINLPYGSPDDPAGRETVCGLGNRKNELFNERLAREGVDVYESSVRFIDDLRENGIRTALVSSSKNARAVLKAAKLENHFDACLDGVDAARLQLKGKPNPDIFLHAAHLLEVSPARAFGLEDALSGVEALKAAHFGLDIGIDRANQGAELRQHGADFVVRDLGELKLEVREAAVQLPNALDHYAEITDRLVAHHPAIFLDYDGTLTPIVARPELAVLSDEMRGTLRSLATLCPVAIVSGRDRAVVEQLVGIDGLIYAGSHGFDIAGPGLRREYDGALKLLPALDRAEDRLRHALANISGVIIERKRFAIAVHYRLVAATDFPRVQSAVNDAIEDAKNSLSVSGGKKAFSIRPNLPWDKGRAVVWLLGQLGLDRPDVLPFYFGDDLTDEDAFAALKDRNAIGILIATAPQRTAAQYVLANPNEVERFLGRLITWLRAAKH